MSFLNWLWKQFLTRPGRVAVAGLVVAMAGGVVEQIRVTRGAGSIVAACGSWMLVVAMLIWLLTVVGRALPEGTDIAARVMIDVIVALFLAFFQLLVAGIATSADPSVIAAVATNKGAKGPGGHRG